jgi:hypothetical protein
LLASGTPFLVFDRQEIRRGFQGLQTRTLNGFSAAMSAAIISYARVLTDDQNLDLQQDALTRAGCTRLSL